MRTLILTIHIACGALAMIAGLAAMRARKKRGLHTQAGTVYHALYVGLFLSAAALALLDWARLWWFLPIATGSYAFALLGYLAARLRFSGWMRFHLTGQGGSYIAMVTALLVVNLGVGSWWVWLLPSVVGSALIAWITREVAAGRRPLVD